MQKQIYSCYSLGPVSSPSLLVGVASGPWSCCDELNTCLSDAQGILKPLPMVVVVGKDEFLFFSRSILS